MKLRSFITFMKGFANGTREKVDAVRKVGLWIFPEKTFHGWTES